jgi:hypothetical protein
MGLKKGIYIALLTLSLTSCKKWLDVNHDPNYPVNVNIEDVLPSGISSISYVMGGKYQVLGALWSQHWTQSPGASQYAGVDAYNINSSSFDNNQFGELYAGALKSFEFVKTESAKQQEWNYYFISTVMQVYIFQILADLYDEIPFSEALQGDAGSMSPHFEKGQDVYDSLIVRIDNAFSKNLDKTNLKNPAERDLIFSGDMDQWKKFANTLKLKIYLRQSEARPEIAKLGIQKLYTEKAEFLTSDAAMVAFQDVTGRQNPLWSTEMIFSGGNPNLILSRTLHSYLEKNGDFDRLGKMFNQPENGVVYKSLIQGNYNAPGEVAGINSSSFSKPVMGPADPVFLMSRSESYFLQAEAIVRYNVASYAKAKEFYEDGIKASFERLSLTDAKAATFYSGPYRFPSNGSPVETMIKNIIVQKWVALAGIQSLETFFEHNRTHYPENSIVRGDNADYQPGTFTISVNNVTSGRFPKRLIFPESEISGNPNTPQVQPVWVNVWWDTKPE